MALKCAHCGAFELTHKTSTAGCVVCGQDTFYDGTAALKKTNDFGAQGANPDKKPSKKEHA